MRRREIELPAPILVGSAVGYGSIFLGGLVAAVTAPLELEKGSWLAAYLVLIAGLAQVFLAHQSNILGAPAPAVRPLWLQLLLWFGGNVLVILGSLLAAPIIVDVGGLALVIALVLALRFTLAAPPAWRVWALRLFYVAVIVSVPIGLVLAHMRA